MLLVTHSQAGFKPHISRILVTKFAYDKDFMNTA
jgi:hypothetical protein